MKLVATLCMQPIVTYLDTNDLASSAGRYIWDNSPTLASLPVEPVTSLPIVQILPSIGGI